METLTQLVGVRYGLDWVVKEAANYKKPDLKVATIKEIIFEKD